MARFLVQTIPHKLPELLIIMSSQGPHLMGVHAFATKPSEHWSRTSDAPKELWVNAFNMSERVTIMRVGAATYGVGGVKERGMEVEREGGGQRPVSSPAEGNVSYHG